MPRYPSYLVVKKPLENRGQPNLAMLGSASNENCSQVGQRSTPWPGKRAAVKRYSDCTPLGAGMERWVLWRLLEGNGEGLQFTSCSVVCALALSQVEEV